MPLARNILLIMTDQHRANTVSRLLGRRYLHTPALDRLAAESVLFNRAYTPSPVCVPARNSIFTGLYPHQTRIECNRHHPRSSKPVGHVSDAFLPADIRGIGAYFGEAGYETAYFGKWHINMPKDGNDQHGFATTGVLELTGHDPEVAEEAASFLKSPRSKPFFAVCSFSDPHDVCQYADGRPLPGGPLPDPPDLADLPPLPENMAPSRNEPEILRELREAYYQVHVEERNNSEEAQRKCRELVWGYYRLVERVDELIGRVIASLEEAGLAEDTLVVYTSDHGELLGAHGLVQKTFFYEEATHVPLYMRLPRGFTGNATAPKPASGSSVSDALVNVGVDLLPTLLDAVGLPISAGLPGSSLLPHATSPGTADEPEYVIGQVHFCSPKMSDETLKTYGRMVRSRRFTYCLFDQGKDREVLFDSVVDPGETNNLSLDKSVASVLETHRSYLRRHAESTADTRAIQMLDAMQVGAAEAPPSGVIPP